MSTDDPRTLLQDAAAGPVTPLNHEELRRRARNRTWSRWAATAVAVLTVVAGVGTLIANLAGSPTVDVVDTPASTVAPTDPLPGLPEFPVTLDLPPAGEVAAVHVGERPVFVVHRDDEEVLVLDAISPHTTTELPKVVAFCRQPWLFETLDEQTAVETPGTFADLWHASRFALDGTWIGGPAPTGLPSYQVQSVGSGTIDIGPPSPAPEREVGPFEDRLGPRSNVHGRDISGPSCTSSFDQTRGATQPGDQTEVLWHQPQHPERWLYPFDPDGEHASADDNVEPSVEGEQSTSQQQPQGARPMEAALIILAFVATVVAAGLYLRRREADGSLDAGPSSVSRPGLRRLFDFGPGGWTRDGKNQPPND